jgi:hypothetical protein
MRNAYTVFVVKPKGKRLLGRPRHRWEVDIKLEPKEIGREGMDWIYLA